MEKKSLNKVRFFSQYWGQRVFVNPILSSLPVNNIFLFNYAEPEDIEDEYLELKPISSITDEDAIEFFDIVWAKVGTHKDKSKEFKIDFGKDWATSPMSERYGLIPTGLFHGVDYLRSKGYALPWMGLSVEKLVEYGWIKLVK